jgi:hypothetical protein
MWETDSKAHNNILTFYFEITFLKIMKNPVIFHRSITNISVLMWGLHKVIFLDI